MCLTPDCLIIVSNIDNNNKEGNTVGVIYLPGCPL